MSEESELRNPQTEARLQEIADRLHASVNEVAAGCGFALMVFKFGSGGNMFYTSNANRDDMIGIMKEFIAGYRGN